MLWNANPSTGLNLWTAIIPAGAALIAIIAMAVLGRKGKKGEDKNKRDKNGGNEKK